MKLMKSFTFWLTLLAIIACLFNLTGNDPENVLFLAVSVPAWIYGLFKDIHTINFLLQYAITIAFWFFIGRLCDRLIQGRITTKEKS